MAGYPRRGFLLHSCAAAVAAFFGRLIPLRGEPAPPDFHVHPRYREQTPLDPLLAKADAAKDDFVAEQCHDRLAPILAEWRGALFRSPGDTGPLQRVLAEDFLGVAMEPVELRDARPAGAITIRRATFPTERTLGSAEFLAAMKAAFASFSKILTAEFQITAIDMGANAAKTRVRYELAGAREGIHREQRIGYWNIEWMLGNVPRITSWTAEEETIASAKYPVFADISGPAFAGAPSYSKQLLHGVDYWRTVLDGASGIDLYGHNGVAVGDIDGDGFDDLYVCQPAGLPNRLYRNKGDGTFEDVTEASGVGLLDNTACAIFADFSNAGRQDLLVVRASGPLLFVNEGSSKFRLQVDAFQFANPPQGTFTGASVADYDRDGWLDIYFCLYIYYQGTDRYKYPTPYHDAENGPPNFLVKNNRDGSFRDATKESGLDKNNTRFSFSCAWNDFDHDGWPDLYVANDFGRKNLYRNNGDGTFTDVAANLGVEDVGAGMSAAWFDYDNDGAEDLYVADMWTAAGERISAQAGFRKESQESVRELFRKHAMGNSLFRNQGSSFRDATKATGTGMGRWSWSSDAWDFDHDGFQDLYIVNGMVSGPRREDLNSFFWRQVVSKSPDIAVPSFEYEQGWNALNELVRADHTWSGYERNVFCANNGDGSYSDISAVAGLDFLEDGRAFALADFDHDGRQEVFLKSRGAPQLRVLKNVMAELAPSISFRLRGTRSNRDGIGAVITVGSQTRTLNAGSGFLSQHSKEVFFGLGRALGPVSAVILWPSGHRQELAALQPNNRVVVEEGGAFAMQPFRKVEKVLTLSEPRAAGEVLPEQAATWLLDPITAPVSSLEIARGRICLVSFWSGALPGVFATSRADWASKGLDLLTVNADEPRFADVVAVYNLVFRYMFDRHRDMVLPTSFLIDKESKIVKVYQGVQDAKAIASDLRNIPRTAEERLAIALPFVGASEHFSMGRNHLSLGAVFFQRGYHEQAEASFQAALRDNPANAEARYGMGSVYLAQAKIDDARASFEEAVKLKAGYPDTHANAWNNLGLIAAREGKLEAAINYFQEALRVNPDHFAATQNLGNAYRQSLRWGDAQRTLERAHELRPRDAEAGYGLAMVYAQTGDTGRAQELLLQALVINPVYAEALNNLAILYLRTRRRDEGIAKLQECIRVAPAFDQAYLNLARVYTVEGDPDKAKSVLRELLKQHPDHVKAREALEALR